MLSVYRIELRRSPLLTALPLMLLVDLVVLFGRSRYWIGVWPEASAATQVVSLFLGPVLAAVSAWQAGRSSRTGMPDFLLAAARPGWRAEAQRLAATLTLGFVAYGTGAATAAAVSFGEAGPGFLWPSYLLLGVATLTLFAAVGHLVGRWWPSPAYAPVVCALGGFVFLLAVGQNYGFFVLSGSPDVTTRPLPIALHLILAVALAALAVSAPQLPKGRWDVPRRPQPRQARGAAVCAAALALSAVAALPAAGEVREARSASVVEPLCDRAEANAPEVCVWPEHRKYLPELTAMAHRLATIPQPWITPPATFYEEGLRRSEYGDAGFGIAEGHVRAAAIAMAGQTSMQSLSRCLPPRDARRAWQASDRIDLWLEYRAMGIDPAAADKGLHTTGAVDTQQFASEVVTLSEPEQTEWISQERAHLRKAGCPS
ncbi:DUF7224 domain-containing protein [Streptomyces sp. NPDC001780]